MMTNQLVGLLATKMYEIGFAYDMMLAQIIYWLYEKQHSYYYKVIIIGIAFATY